MYTEVLLLPRSNSGSDYNSATIWSLGAALSDSGREIYVTGYELEPVLRRLKNTAPGGDGVPA